MYDSADVNLAPGEEVGVMSSAFGDFLLGLQQQWAVKGGEMITKKLMEQIEAFLRKPRSAGK